MEKRVQPADVKREEKEIWLIELFKCAELLMSDDSSLKWTNNMFHDS